MAIIKNENAVRKWLNEQHRSGHRSVTVACDNFEGEVHSLDIPLSIRDLEENLAMYSGDDAIHQRAFALLSRKEGLPAINSRLKLDVDLAKNRESEEDLDLDPLYPALFDWQIWTSKLADGVILRFSDGDSDYSFDMSKEDLERLHERIGDFLKVKPKKKVVAQ